MGKSWLDLVDCSIYRWASGAEKGNKYKNRQSEEASRRAVEMVSSQVVREARASDGHVSKSPFDGQLAHVFPSSVVPRKSLFDLRFRFDAEQPPVFSEVVRTTESPKRIPSLFTSGFLGLRPHTDSGTE